MNKDKTARFPQPVSEMYQTSLTHIFSGMRGVLPLGQNILQ